MTVFVAFIMAGVSYPALLLQGRGFPDLSTLPADTWPRISEPGRWYHDMKNLASEVVRANAQWAAKFFSFIVLIETVGMTVALTVIILNSI